MADHCSEKYCIICEIFENHIKKTTRTKHIFSILIPYNDVHMAIWTADSRSFPIIISNIYICTCHSLHTSTMASNRLATSSSTFGGKKCKNQQTCFQCQIASYSTLFNYSSNINMSSKCHESLVGFIRFHFQKTKIGRVPLLCGQMKPTTPTACSDSAKLHHLQPKDCPTCKDQLILNWFAHQASSFVFSFCSLYTTFLASCHGEKRAKQIWDLENTLLHRFYIKRTWNQNLTDWCMVQSRCPMAAIIMPGALGLCFKRRLVHQSNLNAECATSSVHRKQRRHKNNLKLKSNNTKSNNTSTTTEVSPNNPSHHLQNEAL